MFRDGISVYLPRLSVRCGIAKDDCIRGKSIAQQVQATIYYTLFSRLSHTSTAAQDNAMDASSIPPLSQNGIKERLEECERLYKLYEGTLGLYVQETH
jgi:hypothetical protein